MRKRVEKQKRESHDAEEKNLGGEREEKEQTLIAISTA